MLRYAAPNPENMPREDLFSSAKNEVFLGIILFLVCVKWPSWGVLWHWKPDTLIISDDVFLNWFLFALSAPLQVRLFNKTTVIGVDEEQPVFLLKYNKRVHDSFGQAVLYVHTNISTYRVHLYKYSGRIQVGWVDSNRFSILSVD